MSTLPLLPWTAALLAVLGSLSSILPGTAAEIRPATLARPQIAARLREPIAVALAERGGILLVANRRSGTVCVVDLTAARVAAEVPVGKTLSDLVAVRGAHEGDFLVTDWAAHQLYVLRRRGSGLSIVGTLGVSPFPASVCSDGTGRRCFVASQWSRRVTLVDLDRRPDQSVRLKSKAVIALPFAPRLQILSPDGAALVVAGAFGGELAVINVAEARLQTVKTVPGHNIRGLAWSADGRRLLVAQQTLNPLAYTSAVDLHWGSVIANVLRSLDRDALENPDNDVLSQSRLFPLGDVGAGAGDPASLAVTKAGVVYVALAGVGDVAAGRPEKADFRRFHVGVRPIALAASADGSELYVADTFGDSITIVKWNQYHSTVGPPVRISLGPQPPLSAADRGERLFYDARLSHDNWMSCHSCHTDGHTSDQLSDTQGDGSFGAAKRIPSLGGVAQTGRWAWNGSVRELAAQVEKSARTTMHGESLSREQVRDLTEFLGTLQPAPAEAPADAAGRAAVERGKAVFARQGCDRCHVPPTYTSPATYDVGLEDDLGNRRFNPPSLRGVRQRSALFHDGRAQSLESVFWTFRHPGKTDLAAGDRADLVAFLRSL